MFCSPLEAHKMSVANYSADGPEMKKHVYSFVIFLGGPMGPIHPVWARAAIHPVWGAVGIKIVSSLEIEFEMQKLSFSSRQSGGCLLRECRNSLCLSRSKWQSRRNYAVQHCFVKPLLLSCHGRAMRTTRTKISQPRFAGS